MIDAGHLRGKILGDVLGCTRFGKDVGCQNRVSGVKNKTYVSPLLLSPDRKQLNIPELVVKDGVNQTGACCNREISPGYLDSSNRGASAQISNRYRQVFRGREMWLTSPIYQSA